MKTRPIGYESQKCVLKYMSAQKRLQLANCAPLVRTAEKIVPLRIQNLTFSNYETIVNGDSYKLGIYRKYPENHEDNTEHIRKTNESGGVGYDLDEFGFEDLSAQKFLLPGDITYLEKDRPTRNTDTEKLLIQDALELFQREITRRNGHRDHKKDKTIEYYMTQIDKMKTALLPFYYRERNVKAPHELFIQLTVKYSSGEERIERVKCGPRRLYDAMKYLNSVLLGDRRHTVKVHHLKIDLNSLEGNLHIRLPLDLKISIRELATQGNMTGVYDSLLPVLSTDQNISLDLLYSEKIYHTNPDYDHPVVKNAKRLVLGKGVQHQFVPDVYMLTNPEFHLEEGSDTVLSFGHLVIRWINTGRKIGTCYTTRTRSQTMFIHLVYVIDELGGGERRGDRCIATKLNDESELVVSYYHEKGGGTGVYHYKIEVVAVNPAV